MAQLPAGFVLLNESVYRSMMECLKDFRMPRFSAFFVLLDQTVAIHDGHSVTGIGPEYPEIFGCLNDALGDKSDGVIVLDRQDRAAWWASTADATEFLARHNPPPPTYLSEVKRVPRMAN